LISNMTLSFFFRKSRNLPHRGSMKSKAFYQNKKSIVKAFFKTTRSVFIAR
jgi:hypothetical protein